MDAPTQSSDTRAELARLRRRAYGPDADIAGDPEAMARLRALERPRPEEATGVVAGIPRAVAVQAPRLDEAHADVPGHMAPEVGAVRTAPHSEPASRPWWRRPAIVIAALAVALIVIAASLIPALRGGADRTLAQTPAAAEVPFPDRYEWWTSSLGVPRDALRSYRGVGDITVWAGTSKDGVSCLLVIGKNNPFGFGCSRAGRDATADIVLDSDMASLPNTGLAERTTIRFTYRGDRVDVWITEP